MSRYLIPTAIQSLTVTSCYNFVDKHFSSPFDGLGLNYGHGIKATMHSQACCLSKLNGDLHGTVTQSHNKRVAIGRLAKLNGGSLSVPWLCMKLGERSYTHVDRTSNSQRIIDGIFSKLNTHFPEAIQHIIKCLFIVVLKQLYNCPTKAPKCVTMIVSSLKHIEGIALLHVLSL